ncbi:MAG: 16S rRNA (cytosine(1402)-N(4))-methyltransferase RsmH [Pyrinomonadaceae bacterium]
MPDNDAEKVHTSVMLDEALSLLAPSDGGLFVDATIGMGGHTEAILLSSADSRVIGIDQDTAALALAETRLMRFSSRVELVHGNFESIKTVVGERQPSGIIADLGVSSLQLDSETRGFSFRFDAPLDMRMDTDSGGITAAELLESEDQDAIANIIYQYGEERHSRRIARRIVERRERGEAVKTTFELANLVRRSVPHSKKDKIHPATRTFQALRIAVNRELEIIEKFIDDAVDILKINGVLAIITFHSLEDRIVKQAFQRLSGKCLCPPKIPQCMCGAKKRVEILTRKPLTASESEQDENPRSRSAKLRASRKIGQ